MIALLVLAAWNDSAVIGVGGTVEAFDTATKVRMASEHIEVDFARRKVYADFSFHNLGEATTVTMGFPEEGTGDIQPPTPAKPTHFISFESWVDHRPVKTELWRGDIHEMYYKQWWIKSVDFAAGQTRRVRNVYVTQYSSDIMTIERMTYVLGTGRPWQGSIGSAKVVFDIGGVPEGDLMLVSPRPTRRSKNLLVYEFKDFEPPSAEFAISVGRVARDSVFDLKPGAKVGSDTWVLRR
ncbi:MAG: hypothetical protein IT207_01350 [Fimbriimonadaceae bacterium]|nr:hypothetical protein [Fimbriimonadaceae bacterium]